MARCLELLGENPLLISVLGTDSAAAFLKQDLESVGLDTSGTLAHSSFLTTNRNLTTTKREICHLSCNPRPHWRNGSSR